MTDTSSNQATCTGDVFVTSVRDVNADGVVSPSDAVYVVNNLGADDMDADVDGSGTVDDADVQLVLDALGSRFDE